MLARMTLPPPSVNHPIKTKIINMTKTCNKLSINVCSDVPTGNYSIDEYVTNKCFLYKEYYKQKKSTIHDLTATLYSDLVSCVYDYPESHVMIIGYNMIMRPREIFIAHYPDPEF